MRRLSPGALGLVRPLAVLTQSGTGKTAVFAMGILQMLDTSSSDTQALVLSPTRELAEQTQKVRVSHESGVAGMSPQYGFWLEVQYWRWLFNGSLKISILIRD